MVITLTFDCVHCLNNQKLWCFLPRNRIHRRQVYWVPRSLHLHQPDVMVLNQPDVMVLNQTALAAEPCKQIQDYETILIVGSSLVLRFGLGFGLDCHCRI